MARPPRRDAVRAAAVEPPGLARALAVALALTLAAHLLPLAVASNWLWGVDRLRWWPAPEVAALVALALAGWVPPLGRALARALDALGDAWTRGGAWADALVALAGGAALLVLRDPLRWPGDAMLRASMVRAPRVSAALLAQAYPLDRWIDVELPRGLVTRGLTAEGALQVVGALVGATFLFVAFRFLRACGARAGALPAGALALAGGALTVHFAGYDKFGPLMVGLALAALGAVRLAREGRGAWTLAAGALVAVHAHRSAYLLLPALAWVLARDAVAAPRTRGRTLLAALVVLAGYALLLPRTLDLALHYDRVVHLPGGAVAGTRAARGALDAMVRASDALNVLAYLVPLGAAGAVAGWGAGRAGGGARTTLRVAGALAVGAFALLLVGVEPGGGWTKDWDVAVGVGTLVACGGAGALVAVWSAGRARATLAPAVTLAVALLIPTWQLHVDAAAAQRRVEAALAGTPAWRGAVRTQSYDFLGSRAFGLGDFARAATLFDAAIDAGGPNPRLLFQAGRARLETGAYELAARRFRAAVALAPGNAQAWSGLAFAALKQDDGPTARACVDSALAHDPALPSARQIARILDQAGVP